MLRYRVNLLNESIIKMPRRRSRGISEKRKGKRKERKVQEEVQALTSEVQGEVQGLSADHHLLSLPSFHLSLINRNGDPQTTLEAHTISTAMAPPPSLVWMVKTQFMYISIYVIGFVDE